MTGDGFRLDAYLRRIGIGRRPSPAELHRAHVTSIPFENLDPHRGVPVSLELEALQDKLVDRGRGGYCFEQNLLLAWALRAIGTEVETLLARVRLGRPAGTPRPRTHLVLRVRAGGEVWLADAGFGGGTLLEPIPFEPGGVYVQSGWQFRIVRDGAEHVLEIGDDSGFTELYGFTLEPVPHVDIEVSNWFTSSHPRSPFVTGLNVTRVRADGTFIALSDWSGLSLTERSAAATVSVPVSREEIPALLSARFGLNGFGLGPGGRIRAI
ncbi:MAG: arylamine N-acetyltransferase family protein [Solirubrobacteraceae bacterium]